MENQLIKNIVLSLLIIAGISFGQEKPNREIDEKTGKPISVPLLSQPKVILAKYNDVGEYALPKFSNQKINSYLKEMADIVGIKKSISHHMARKTFASTVLLYNDVPMEIVSELLGHSSMKITQDYYGKVVQKRVSQEILRLTRKE